MMSRLAHHSNYQILLFVFFWHLQNKLFVAFATRLPLVAFTHCAAVNFVETFRKNEL